MRKIVLSALSAVMAVALTAAAADAPATAPVAPASPVAAPASEKGGLKLAYVDINAVLNQYQRRADMEKELKAVSEQLNTESRVRLDEINKLAKEIEQLAMGTPERQALQDKLKKAEGDLQDFRRNSYDRMNREIVRRMNTLYDEILNVTSQIGREKGLDFIFKDQASPLAQDSTRGEAALQVTQRVVLYAKPEYDLTSDVAKRLNDAYAKSKPQPQKPDQPAGAPETK